MKTLDQEYWQNLASAWSGYQTAITLNLAAPIPIEVKSKNAQDIHSFYLRELGDAYNRRQCAGSR